MHLSTAFAFGKLKQSGQLFTELFRHGSLTVEIYQPSRVDFQQPHQRDELYVIISGTGEFYHEGVLGRFEAGDVFFVNAGHEHRFLNFSEDFSTWVFFFGPTGGESNVPATQF